MGHRQSKKKDSKMRKTKFLTLIAIFVALFASSGTLFAQNVTNFKYLLTLEGHTKNINSVCWSPDGKYFASGSEDKTIKIWDANSGACIRTLKGHSYTVYSVCWSPNGKYLASGASDYTVKIWDAKSGMCIRNFKGHSYTVYSV